MQLLVIFQDCNIAKLREPPKAYDTKADCESISWPREDLGYGNNSYDVPMGNPHPSS